ncbi:hypothetical protein L3X38_002302 [Prunus dulcis]|uniref:DUF4219 domain-containing protein n=1 Tax=Prunus dulcis TaxID=3755 RepID=A0AAD4WTN5_PRUDU|nr:hypothetical protein L3X38_002302 [Prunus dulcis]
MAGSGGGELRAPIFNGENYEFWSIRMKTIFKSHGIWELVEKGIGSSDSKGADESDTKQKEKEESSGSGKMAIAEILMKDGKALGLIQEAVSEEIFPRISHEESSHGAWNILKQEFHGDKQVRSVKLQSLRREFEYTRMREDESLSAYLTKLFDLINQMKGYGEELSRERIVQKMLISLLPGYDPICSVIEHSRDLDVIEVQEVVASLKSFAQRLERHHENKTEKAFASLSVDTKSAKATGNQNSKQQKNWKDKGKKWEINLLMELKLLANIVGNCIMENVDSRANRSAITVTSLVTLPKTAIARNLWSSSSFSLLLSVSVPLTEVVSEKEKWSNDTVVKQAEHSVENELLTEDNEERSVVDTDCA